MVRKSRRTAATPMVDAMPVSRKQYSVGLYARISVENEKKREADSIGTQIQMLRDFVSSEPDMEVYDLYYDDDISGVDFERPNFKRMMELVRIDKVHGIIVKNLSRFGREYLVVQKVRKPNKVSEQDFLRARRRTQMG